MYGVFGVNFKVQMSLLVQTSWCEMRRSSVFSLFLLFLTRPRHQSRRIVFLTYMLAHYARSFMFLELDDLKTCTFICFGANQQRKTKVFSGKRFFSHLPRNKLAVAVSPVRQGSIKNVLRKMLLIVQLLSKQG